MAQQIEGTRGSEGEAGSIYISFTCSLPYPGAMPAPTPDVTFSHTQKPHLLPHAPSLEPVRHDVVIVVEVQTGPPRHYVHLFADNACAGRRGQEGRAGNDTNYQLAGCAIGVHLRWANATNAEQSVHPIFIFPCQPCFCAPGRAASRGARPCIHQQPPAVFSPHSRMHSSISHT